MMIPNRLQTLINGIIIFAGLFMMLGYTGALEVGNIECMDYAIKLLILIPFLTGVWFILTIGNIYLYEKLEK